MVMDPRTDTLGRIIDITAVIPDWRDLFPALRLALREGEVYPVEDFFGVVEEIDDEHATLAQRIADKLPEDGVSFIRIS